MAGIADTNCMQGQLAEVVFEAVAGWAAMELVEPEHWPSPHCTQRRSRQTSVPSYPISSCSQT